MMLQLSTSDWKVSAGDANANDGFHWIQIRNCQKPRNRPWAGGWGHAAFKFRRPRDTFGATGTSSASSPAVSVRSSTAMAADLVLEPVGDRRRQTGDVERVEPARPRDPDRVLLHDPARPARQEDHPVAQADGLAHVVGHEDHGYAGLAPHPFELLVQYVARHRVERAE